MTKRFTLALVSLYLTLPEMAKAQIFEGTEGTAPDTQTGTQLIRDELSGTGITHTETFSDLIIKYVNFVLPYLALGAFAGLVWAGFLYITAYGNEDQLGKAKKIIIWSIVGLLLVIVSFAIIQFFTVDLVEGLQNSAIQTGS